MTTNNPLKLSVYLKENTTTTHDSLDKRVMSLNPFSTLENYTQFIRSQARLQQVASPWYQNTAMQAYFPDLAERDRYQAVLQDCKDLGLSAADLAQDQAMAGQMQINNPYEALGWLYAVEGSNIGAAILLKHAKEKLGLSEEHGARHLTGHGDGRALYWKRFKEALDTIELNEDLRLQALKGAKDAFVFTRANIEELLAPLAKAI